MAAGFDRGDLRIRVREVRGAARIEREFENLPKQARDELRKGLNKITQRLAVKVRAAGRRQSKQSARASNTVRPSRGTRPAVAAGPHPLLFLSEFGMERHTGWYGKPRYNHSKARNSGHPHLGGGSYWFFKTQEESSDDVQREAREIADAVVRNWR